jgi:hypothetical protein
MQYKKKSGFQKSMMILASAPVVAVIGLFVFFSRNKQGIQAPVPAADIAFFTYKIDASEINFLEQRTGTLLTIPAHAFVDDSGQPVTGEVTFKVREFHETSDLLRAGIPMRVFTGSEDVLQSAGMLEFRAFQGGRSLELKKGTSIGIELASFRPSEGYDLYFLEDDSEWEVTDTFARKNNERKQQDIACLKEKIYQRCGIPSEEDEIVFELGGNPVASPYLRPLAGMQWLLCPLESDPNYRTALREIWEAVNVQKPRNDDYLFPLQFSRVMYKKVNNGPDLRTFRAKALVVPEDCEGLPDWDQLVAELSKMEGRFSSVFQNLEESLKLMEEETQRIRNQADLVNVFEANKMGLYNIDKLLKLDSTFQVILAFDVEENYPSDRMEKAVLYSLWEAENSVIAYEYNDFKKVRVTNRSPISFMLLLPDGKMAVVEAADVLKALAGGKKILRLQTRVVEAASFLKSKHSPSNPV